MTRARALPLVMVAIVACAPTAPREQSVTAISTPSGAPLATGSSGGSTPTTLQQEALANGMRVDVGGYQLFVRCTGQGSPPAVFDAGATLGHSTWSLVEPQVAAFTTTCVYDRANRENSDEGPSPNTSQQIVNDLHTLLDRIHVAGPFVLVGQSFGGLNMQLYARLYPTESAGLALVDAAHEASYLGRDPAAPHWVAWGVDYTESAHQVQAAPPLPAIPLIVIEHGLPGGTPFSMPQWHAWQQDLASRSPHRKVVVAEHSSHQVEVDQPELVVAAVREIVEQARR